MLGGSRPLNLHRTATILAKALTDTDASQLGAAQSGEDLRWDRLTECLERLSRQLNCRLPGVAGGSFLTDQSGRQCPMTEASR